MNWSKGRIFYSHASSDIEITRKIQNCIKGIDKNLQIYVADRVTSGIPLLEKLKDEIYSSNALILGWTESCSKTNTDQIISFELGMAYVLGLPIYILKFTDDKLPWFFNHITDYEEIKNFNEEMICDKLKKFDFTKFYAPIDIMIPREILPKYGLNKNQSKNIEVVQEDGSIEIESPFNDIIHFRLINNRPKPEKNLRIIIDFPTRVKIIFDTGTLNGSSGVQKNELFELLKYSENRVRMIWPSLPSSESFNFELRLRIDKLDKSITDKISITISGDSISGLHKKEIPIKIY